MPKISQSIVAALRVQQCDINACSSSSHMMRIFCTARIYLLIDINSSKIKSTYSNKHQGCEIDCIYSPTKVNDVKLSSSIH